MPEKTIELLKVELKALVLQQLPIYISRDDVEMIKLLIELLGQLGD